VPHLCYYVDNKLKEELFMSDIVISKGYGNYNHYIPENLYNFMVNFLKEFLEEKENYRVKGSELYEKYVEVCNSREAIPLSRKQFSVVLDHLGYQRSRSNSGKFYYGYRFKQR